MYPDFLCIGAPKGGTTWLFDNLQRHPDIWVPPLKSVQYFSGKANKIRLKRFRRRWRRILRPASLTEAMWFIRYFLSPLATERWYASLFPNAPELVKGEMAPSYTACSPETVRRIQSKMPAARIIFFMRDPVERAWSHAQLQLVTTARRDIKDISEQEFIEVLESESFVLRSSYPRTLQTWRQHYPEDQVFIRFFEEIADRPFELLEEVCQFLQVDDDKKYFAKTAQRNIFKGAGHEMPMQIRQLLSRRYLNDLQQLSEEFGGYATDWLRTAERALATEALN